MSRREAYFVSKVVVITGGSSGIGFALAGKLSASGARVIILADKPESVSHACADLSARGTAVHGYVCDIGRPESVADACGQLLAAYGAPDILINNAGFAIYRTFEQEETAEVERLMSVNFAGAIRVTKALLSGMIERRGGQIVNITSIAGSLPLTPCAVYGAAKHGIMGWSRCLSSELARFGMSVTTVCPGRVRTNFFDHESFKKRPRRKETELTVPMEVVVESTLDAIRRRQRVRYIPRYYGALAWAYNALGPFARGQWDRIMRSRVEDLYRHSETQ